MQTRPLTKGTAHFSGQAISLDGKWIAFTNTLANRQIYKMPIEGGTPIQLTFLDADHSSPAWSVDGKRIAFISDEGGSSKIWIVDAGGGKPRQLAKTQPDPMGSFTIWSLGARILYGRGPGVFGANTILDPETEEEKPLFPDATGSVRAFPKFSPDGKRVAVIRPKQSGLWVISLADNSAKLLTNLTLSPFGWSPDGNWIYAMDFSTPRSILLAPSSGGNPKTIFAGKNLIPFGWSPDGSWIYVEDTSTPGATNILSVPTGGGDSRTLLTLTGNASFSASPDGRRFIYTAIETKSDVWLVENFDPARRK